jgi:hypothetical protein
MEKKIFEDREDIDFLHKQLLRRYLLVHFKSWIKRHKFGILLTVTAAIFFIFILLDYVYPWLRTDIDIIFLPIGLFLTLFGIYLSALKQS